MCPSPVAVCVCRACLAGEVRMHAVQDTQLLDIYEKLTNTKLNTAMGIPQVICYMCYSQLQSCRTFCATAQRSEGILRDLIHKGIEVTNKTVNSKSNLGISPTQHLSINDLNNDLALITVKEEPATIKEEPRAVKEEPATIKEEPRAIKEESRAVKAKSNAIGTRDNFLSSAVQEEQILVKIETLEDDDNDEWPALEEHALLERKGSPAQDINARFDESLDTEAFNQSLSPSIEDENSKDLNSHLYICDVCDKKFPTKQKLKNHLYTHLKKPYACNICKRKCNRSSNLQKHQKCCSIFSCDTCAKTFAYKSNLIIHMRRHTRERPFSCDICGKTFSFESSLIPHMRYYHTREKPYACRECDKRFAENGTLRRHMIVHLKQKPYTCNTCECSFTEPGSLRRHKREIHGSQRRYPCDECDRTYVRNYRLRLHKLTHLKDESS